MKQRRRQNSNKSKAESAIIPRSIDGIIQQDGGSVQDLGILQDTSLMDSSELPAKRHHSFFSKPKKDNNPKLAPVQRDDLSNEFNEVHDDFMINSYQQVSNDNIVDESIEKSHNKKHRLGFNPFKWIKRFASVLGLFVVIFIGYFGLKLYVTANNVIQGDDSSAPALSGKEDIPLENLEQVGDSRINVLIMGTGSIYHEGSDLSDTNIIATIDPVAKTAGLFSIPRDAYVDIPQYGSARINNALKWGDELGYDNGGGVGLMIDTVERNFDIPIHYYVTMNFDGFEQIIDAVGGVEVNVTDSIVDYAFREEELGYPPPFIVNPGLQTMDGATALNYVRSRKTSARGDFARSDRQRDVVQAVADKALSLGTFSDPRKISSLLSAVSGNLRTNVSLSDMNQMYSIGSKIHPDEIRSAGVSTDADSFLQNSFIDGASVVTPTYGNYTEVSKYFFDLFPDRFIQQEQPTVAVYNATFTEGLAGNTADDLEKLGYQVLNIETLSTFQTQYGTNVYSTASNKPYTTNYLENQFDTKVQNSGLPSGVNTSADFIILIGENNEQF